MKKAGLAVLAGISIASITALTMSWFLKGSTKKKVKTKK